MKEIMFKELRRMQKEINRVKKFGEHYQGELQNMAHYQLGIIECLYLGGLITKNTYDIGIEVYGW